MAPPAPPSAGPSSRLLTLSANIPTPPAKSKKVARRVLYASPLTPSTSMQARVIHTPLPSPHTLLPHFLTPFVGSPSSPRIDLADSILDFLDVSQIQNQDLKEEARNLQAVVEYLRLPIAEQHPDLELFLRTFLDGKDLECETISRSFTGTHRTKFFNPFSDLLERNNKNVLIYLCAEHLQTFRAVDLGKWSWLVKADIVEMVRAVLPFDLGILEGILSKTANECMRFSKNNCINVMNIVLEHIVQGSPCDNLCYSDREELLVVARHFLFELENRRVSSSIDNTFTEIKERLSKIVVLENNHLQRPEIHHGDLTGLHYLPGATAEKIPQTFEIPNSDPDSFGVVEVKVPLLVDKRETMAIGVYSYAMRDATTGTIFHSHKLSSFILGGRVSFENYVEAIGYILQHPLNTPTITQINRKKYLGSYTVNGIKISLLIWTCITPEGEKVVSAYPVILEELREDGKSEYKVNMYIAEVANDGDTLTICQNTMPNIATPNAKLQRLKDEASPLKYPLRCSMKDKKMILIEKLQRYTESWGVEIMPTDPDSDRIILQVPFPCEGSFKYFFNLLIEKCGYTTLQKEDIDKTFGHTDYGAMSSYLVCSTKLLEKFFSS